MELFLRIILSRYFIGFIQCLLCISFSLSAIVRVQKYKVLGKTAKKITATWEKFLH